MRGASKDSLARLSALAEPKLDGGAATGIAGELLSVVGVLVSSAPLRRSLADAAVAEEAKRGVVEQLFGSVISKDSLELLQAAATLRWASAQELVSGVEEVAVTAAAAAAQAQGRLEETERELFSFADVVSGSHDLQRAFADVDATAEAKAELSRTLLGSQVSEEARMLIEQAAAHPRGARIGEALAGYAGILAARAARDVAEITSAAPLTDAQTRTLRERLSRVHGRELGLHVVVDPSVIGGFRIRVGDEVIDDTVAGRLAEVQRTLAG